jgi:hypothetical protein
MYSNELDIVKIIESQRSSNALSQSTINQSQSIMLKYSRSRLFGPNLSTDNDKLMQISMTPEEEVKTLVEYINA